MQIESTNEYSGVGNVFPTRRARSLKYARLGVTTRGKTVFSVPRDLAPPTRNALLRRAVGQIQFARRLDVIQPLYGHGVRSALHNVRSFGRLSLDLGQRIHESIQR